MLGIAVWLLATGSAAVGDDPDPYDLNEAPDCTNVKATPNRLSPKGGFALVKLSGATDADGDALTYTITGVRQDEPVGSSPDAQATSDPGAVLLRQERDPGGTGRFYTISYTVSDGTESCSGTTTVVVGPPLKKGSKPVNEGPLYDSFAASS